MCKNKHIKSNKYNVQIEKYAEILDTGFITRKFYYKKELSFY